MFQKIFTMDKSNLTTASSENSEAAPDNTATFLIGFGILLIFVLLGVLASVFLCLTLKKDAYLWDVDQERQLQQKQEMNSKEVEQLQVNEKFLDNTQL